MTLFKKVDTFKVDNLKAASLKVDSFQGDHFKVDTFKTDASKAASFRIDNFKADNIKRDTFKLDLTFFSKVTLVLLIVTLLFNELLFVLSKLDTWVAGKYYSTIPVDNVLTSGS